MGTKLAAVAPLVVPLDTQCTSVEGFIPAIASSSSDQHWVRLSGIAPGSGSLQDAQLELDPKAQELLGPHMDIVHLRLKESPNVAAFLVELRNLLSQAASTAAATASIAGYSLRTPAFYQRLTEDLQSIGWDTISKLSDDLSSVTLRCLDAAGRAHTLSLLIPPTYPSAAPKPTSVDLPIAFNPLWTSESHLTDVVSQFYEVIDSFQRFWDELAELDERAWVIEPTAPSRSCTYRRVALEKHITLMIKLDPLDLGAVPELQFMGSDRAVEPLLDKVRANRVFWQQHNSLLENLAALLGAPLPEKQAEGSTAAEDIGAECAICYNYRRPSENEDVGGGEGGEDHGMAVEGEEGDVPEINCDNPACGKPFHRLCLREWLAADASTRQSFGQLFGACPYCSGPIAVKTR